MIKGVGSKPTLFLKETPCLNKLILKNGIFFSSRQGMV